MRERDVEPNVVSYSAGITACAKVHTVVEFGKGRQVGCGCIGKLWTARSRLYQRLFKQPMYVLRLDTGIQIQIDTQERT